MFIFKLNYQIDVNIWHHSLKIFLNFGKCKISMCSQRINLHHLFVHEIQNQLFIISELICTDF